MALLLLVIAVFGTLWKSWVIALEVFPFILWVSCQQR